VICQNRLIYGGVAVFALHVVWRVTVVDGCSVWIPNMFATQQLINFEVSQPGMKFSRSSDEQHRRSIFHMEHGVCF
jgi:hypothetical protein